MRGCMPNGFVVQELAKRSIGHWNRVVSDRFIRSRLESRISRFNAAGIHPPGVVVEQGTGWHGLDLVLFHLAGADRILTYDTTPWLREEILRRVARTLVSSTPVVKRWRGTDSGVVDERAERLERNLEAPWPALLQSLGITVRVTRSMDRSEMSESDPHSVDLFYSDSTLQFVAPGDLETLIRQSRRFLKASGLSFHVVDCSDLHAQRDPRIPRLAYLTYPEHVWNLMTSRYLNYQNRLRMPQFADMFQRHGLTCRVLNPVVEAEDVDYAQRRLVNDARFEGMSVDDIATRSFCLTSFGPAAPPA